MINASAYIHDNRLVIIGIAKSRWGVVPFTYDKMLEGDFDNGAIDFNNPPDSLVKAIDESFPEIKKKISQGNVRLVAESLVLRSRQGDQNATALLIAVTNNAKRGNRKAARMLEAVEAYIDENPATKDSFGQESEVSKELAKHVSSDVPSHYCSAVLTLAPHVDMPRTIVLLANGPLIDNTLLEAVCNSLDEKEQKHFKMGYSDKNIQSDIGLLGKAFRGARGLQAVRKGNFKQFCPVVCWELGL